MRQGASPGCWSPMFLNVPQTLVAILGHIWDAAGTSKSAQFAFFTKKMVRRNGFSRLSWTGLLFSVFYAHFVAKFGAKIGRKCVTVFIHLRFSFVTLDPHDVSYFTMFYATLVFSISEKNWKSGAKFCPKPFSSKDARRISPAGVQSSQNRP